MVLINRDTASAAEILASAISSYDLGTIVGEPSFGKGTFQEVIHLPAGGALDLTIGEYLTADGVSLAGEGIKPDVRAVDDPKTASRRGARPGAARRSRPSCLERARARAARARARAAGRVWSASSRGAGASTSSSRCSSGAASSRSHAAS